jgi:hypothetical protein
MTTIQLYRKHKAGEVSREKFLYEVRRDQNLPWVTNVTSYDDAVKILKNKGIISEADANVATDPAVDKVNPYFLKKGVQKILANEKELTNDSYINALNKAAKQLEANPHAFNEDMFANAKEVEKADSKLETEEVKKNNFVNKDRQMKKAKGHNIEKANTKVSTKENKKGKPKGVQMMKESVLQDLLNFLKKKELINEDSHWKHTVGSEVHTPDGPGKIVEIMGSTLTIEMEDGTHKDYQINVVDNATEKAMEEQSSEEPKAEPSKDDVKDMWAKWDKERGIDLGKYVVDPGYHSELDKKYGKLKEYIAKHKDDKEKMNKLKKAIKELVLLRSKKSKKTIPGAYYSSAGAASTAMNSFTPDVKSQIEVDPTQYE